MTVRFATTTSASPICAEAACEARPTVASANDATHLLPALVSRSFLDGHDLTLMVGSIGASAVLVYGAPRSPLAQPRNLVAGHLLSAIVGVACWKLLHPWPWLAASVAVATAIALMHATRTLHPPGGATALIAVIGSPDVHALGFLYVLVPCTLAPLGLLAVALVVNNIPRFRRYPEYWL